MNLAFILAGSQSLEDYALVGGAGGVGAILLREGIPMILKYFRRNGNGKVRSGDLSPEIWKNEFHNLQQILDNQTTILKTAVELLGDIKTNTAIQLDRSK